MWNFRTFKPFYLTHSSILNTAYRLCLIGKYYSHNRLCPISGLTNGKYLVILFINSISLFA